MKKIISIILVFLLLTSQFGVHAKSHYCMDRLTHLQVFALNDTNSESLCACGAEYEKSGCCQDIEVHAANDEVGIAQAALTLPKLFSLNAYFLQPKFFWFEPNLKGTYLLTCKALSPPEPPQWYACLQVTNLLI